MTSTLVSAPSDEAISIAEARMHLRNPERRDNDAEILWFIKAAREQVEHKTGRRLLSQTWDVHYTSFPSSTVIELPYFPAQSITSIIYVDTLGATQTFSSSSYTLENDAYTAYVRLAYNSSWPSARGYASNDVTIRYVAGYLSADQVPESIKQYMKLYIGHLDAHRGLTTEAQPYMNPFAERLLDAERIHSV